MSVVDSLHWDTEQDGTRPLAEILQCGVEVWRARKDCSALRASSLWAHPRFASVSTLRQSTE
jgi:hypothetical protein